MSKINGIPLINEILAGLNPTQLNALKNCINGAGGKPIFRSLKPVSNQRLTISDKGVKPIQLELKTIVGGMNVVEGYLIYTDSMCYVICFSGDKNQGLNILHVNLSNGESEFVNGSLSILELRSELDDVDDKIEIKTVVDEILVADKDILSKIIVEYNEDSNRTIITFPEGIYPVAFGYKQTSPYSATYTLSFGFYNGQIVVSTGYARDAGSRKGYASIESNKVIVYITGDVRETFASPSFIYYIPCSGNVAPYLYSEYLFNPLQIKTINGESLLGSGNLKATKLYSHRLVFTGNGFTGIFYYTSSSPTADVVVNYNSGTHELRVNKTLFKAFLGDGKTFITKNLQQGADAGDGFVDTFSLTDVLNSETDALVTWYHTSFSEGDAVKLPTNTTTIYNFSEEITEI